VLVIAEGLAMYLDGAARRRLFANVRRLAETAGEVQLVFDLTPSAEEPPPGPLGRALEAALEAAMKRATGGRGFERDAQTRGQVMAELAEAGFGELAATAARDVLCAWRLPFPERRTATVVFSAAARATRP
jgi:O-methyltransferase involved in polyketide biosynthesis